MPLNLQIVGWQETVIFPEWNNIKMRAKLDSGAKSSAIHASEYEIIRKPSTKDRIVNEEIRMKVVASISKQEKFFWVTAPIVDYRNVKNSGGKIEERPFISTKVTVGERSYSIILSVTNREKMKFPVLLGRSFLEGKFLIDAGARNLLKKNKKSPSTQNLH